MVGDAEAAWDAVHRADAFCRRVEDRLAGVRTAAAAAGVLLIRAAHLVGGAEDAGG